MSISTFNTEYAIMQSYSNDDAFCNEMKKGKMFEQDLIIHNLLQYITKSSVILDIGGHIGSHSILYSKFNSNCQIYTFEPQKKIYELLNENIIKNNCKNIKTFNNAVGHMKGPFKLSSMIGDGYNHSVEYGTDTILNLGGMQLGTDGEEVEMITIDSLELPSCDYIKIDVEGAENLVIYGGRNTIQKYHPTIFFECTTKLLNEDTINMMQVSHIPSSIKILEDINYTITNVDINNKIAIYKPKINLVI